MGEETLRVEGLARGEPLQEKGHGTACCAISDLWSSQLSVTTTAFTCSSGEGDLETSGEEVEKHGDTGKRSRLYS
jgi:hypothetical protein